MNIDEIREAINIYRALENDMDNPFTLAHKLSVPYDPCKIRGAFKIGQQYLQAYIELVEAPKEPIYYDCTLQEFSKQLNIPLWKAMEFGKYFNYKKNGGDIK